jgi:membrane associated rhomboid family serine protease
VNRLENTGVGLCLLTHISKFFSMLSDRSYMQSHYPRQTTNAVTWVISAVVAGFVLQFVFLRWFSLGHTLEAGLALSVAGVKSGHVWTLLTYGLLHSTTNLLHVVGNLLMVYFLGKVLEPLLGFRRFLGVLAASVVTGALLWLGTHWQTGAEPLVGLTAGVMGLFMVFACFYPNQPVSFLLFFVVPVTVRPKYAVIGLLVAELAGFVFYEVMHAASPFGSGIGFSAHLGGMLAGWVYYRYIHEARWRFASSAKGVELPTWMKKTKSNSAPIPTIDLTRREDLRAEVDRILDKINSHGFGSLTVEEKRLLDDARELLSRR